MAVSITPRTLISALDTNWAETARENDRRGNQNEANLKTAVEEMQNAAAPVRRVKFGSTTYSPDATGQVELPAGVLASPMTTAQRDALVSPGIGLLILNTTSGRPEIYTSTGWQVLGTCQLDVFTASGTWTKPTGAKFVYAICIGGGCGGGASNGSAGPGGGYSAQGLAAAMLPATVSVAVGIGGSGSSGTSNNSGGDSTFGSYVGATGGAQQNRNFAGAPIGDPASPSTYDGNPFRGGAAGGYYGPDSAQGQLNSGYGGGGGGGGQSSSNPGIPVRGGNSGQALGGAPGAQGQSAPGGNGQPGVSRSGTGLAGSGGGGGAYTNALGGAGGIPGGGGGWAGGTGGAGGRGEVLVLTIF